MQCINITYSKINRYYSYVLIIRNKKSETSRRFSAENRTRMSHSDMQTVDEIEVRNDHDIATERSGE